MQDLARLFRICLNAGYTSVENSASFAAQIEGDTLRLLFEWSHGGEDWKNNLDFPAVPYREMEETWYCHRGFLRVWKSAEPYIEQILRQTDCPCITVAGYSHGGALAVLCHEYIWFHEPARRPLLEGYGFGAPRVVSLPRRRPSLAARWEKFTVIRNRDDLVTHLPPRLFGYTHVGTLIEIGKTGRYSSVDAHRPENYLDSLDEYEGIRDVISQFPV